MNQDLSKDHTQQWVGAPKPFLKRGFISLTFSFFACSLLVEEIGEDAFNCSQQKPTGAQLSYKVAVTLEKVWGSLIPKARVWQGGNLSSPVS